MIQINHFQGALPSSLVHCTMLKILDIGNNHISDSILLAHQWISQGHKPILAKIIKTRLDGAIQPNTKQPHKSIHPKTNQQHKSQISLSWISFLYLTIRIFGSIINTMHVSWVLLFSLKYFYKNNDNYIKKKNVIQTLWNKMITLLTLIIDNENS